MDEKAWSTGRIIRASPQTAKFRWMGIISLLLIVFIVYLFLPIEGEDDWFFLFCSVICPAQLVLLSLPLGFGISLGTSGGDGGSGGG